MTEIIRAVPQSGCRLTNIHQPGLPRFISAVIVFITLPRGSSWKEPAVDTWPGSPHAAG